MATVDGNVSQQRVAGNKVGNYMKSKQIPEWHCSSLESSLPIENYNNQWQQLKDNLRNMGHKDYLVDTPSLVELKKQWSIECNDYSTDDFKSGFSTNTSVDNYKSYLQFTDHEEILDFNGNRNYFNFDISEEINGRFVAISMQDVMYSLMIVKRFHTVDESSQVDALLSQLEFFVESMFRKDIVLNSTEQFFKFDMVMSILRKNAQIQCDLLLELGIHKKDQCWKSFRVYNDQVYKLGFFIHDLVLIYKCWHIKYDQSLGNVDSNHTSSKTQMVNTQSPELQKHNSNNNNYHSAITDQQQIPVTQDSNRMCRQKRKKKRRYRWVKTRLMNQDKVNDDYQITKSIINTVELMDVKSECHYVNDEVKTDKKNIKDTSITETLDSHITVTNKCRQSNEICSNNSNSVNACVDKLNGNLNAPVVDNNEITNNVRSAKEKLHNSKVNETINHMNQIKSKINSGVHCVFSANLKLEKEKKIDS